MTRLPHSESPATALAPLARGLMRRVPEILSMSIHDTAGDELWSSGDFLLAEDQALIAAVVEDPHDVRGQSSGLWWESADSARARCALALFEGGNFSGVLLAVFSSLTTGGKDRADRMAAMIPALPVLAREVQLLNIPVLEADDTTGNTRVIAALTFTDADPRDELMRDLAIIAREERLLDLIDQALKEDEFALHLQPIVSLREDEATQRPLIVEVLIRLPTQEFGVLASHEFLDVAERHGRMPKIDRWVIRALLVWMQRNRDRWADANAVISVNLSAK